MPLYSVSNSHRIHTNPFDGVLLRSLLIFCSWITINLCHFHNSCLNFWFLPTKLFSSYADNIRPLFQYKKRRPDRRDMVIKIKRRQHFRLLNGQFTGLSIQHKMVIHNDNLFMPLNNNVNPIKSLYIGSRL